MRNIQLLFLWVLRVLVLLSVLAGVVLLMIDSPLAVHLPGGVTRPMIEAAPLLLVGVALLIWLVIDRPGIVDLIRQGLVAIAFILWGVDLLMPTGRAATFVGAVVIAIYVFDLAWMIESSLGRKLQFLRAPQRPACTD